MYDEIMESVVSNLAVKAISAAIPKVFGFINSKYRISISDENKNKYRDNCINILFIKTIMSPDNAVYIDDIYVPLNIEGEGTVKISIGDSVTLDYDDRALIIKGIAGMGKSTVLRKLFSTCCKEGRYFPIFYEFKNYNGGEIEDCIRRHLLISGLRLNFDHISKVLNDSNTKLFMDAFDECPLEHRDELLFQIQKIIGMYGCRLIVTSRPDTEIDAIAALKTYNISYLTPQQIEKIVAISAADEAKATNLCEAIARTPFHRPSESILKSPILVVLLCVSYNMGEDIPDTLSEFYEKIFDTVFTKHDNIKSGVHRNRIFNDNRRIYQELFKYLSFISQRAELSEFNRDKLIYFSSQALQIVGKDQGLADRFSDEIIKITNLIIKDGYDQYRYVHKSIQEFFSASLVAKMKIEEKKAFYNACTKNLSFYRNFSNSLLFLQDIDYIDYMDYFFIPFVNLAIGCEREPIPDDYSPSEKLINTFTKSIKLRAKHDVFIARKLKVKQDTWELSFPAIEEGVPSKSILFTTAARELYHQLSNYEENTCKAIIDLNHRDGEYYIATLDEIIENCALTHDQVVTALITNVGAMFWKRYNNALYDVSQYKTRLYGSPAFDFSTGL